MAQMWGSIKLKLEAALKKLEEQEAAIEALRTTVHSSRSITFVQNLRTMAIHGMRAGDSSHTACGWGVGAAVQRRGGIRWLSTIEGEPWHIFCASAVCCRRDARDSLPLRRWDVSRSLSKFVRFTCFDALRSCCTPSFCCVSFFRVVMIMWVD